MQTHAAFSSIEYLEHPIYESEHTKQKILEQTEKVKEADAIPPEKIWLGIYFQREIARALHPKISLYWIDEHIGFGVYSAQKIPSCAYVGEYTGIIRKRKPKDAAEENHYCFRFPIFSAEKKFVIDASQKGNFTRFVNHSKTPNLGMQSVYFKGFPRLILISLKEIAEGEQLTIDYGELFWKQCGLAPKAL